MYSDIYREISYSIRVLKGIYVELTVQSLVRPLSSKRTWKRNIQKLSNSSNSIGKDLKWTFKKSFKLHSQCYKLGKENKNWRTCVTWTEFPISHIHIYSKSKVWLYTWFSKRWKWMSFSRQRLFVATLHAKISLPIFVVIKAHTYLQSEYTTECVVVSFE